MEYINLALQIKQVLKQSVSLIMVRASYTSFTHMINTCTRVCLVLVYVIAKISYLYHGITTYNTLMHMCEYDICL